MKWSGIINQLKSDDDLVVDIDPDLFFDLFIQKDFE